MATPEETTKLFDDMCYVCESFEHMQDLTFLNIGDLDQSEDISKYYNLIGTLTRHFRLLLDRADSLGLVS